MTVPVARSGVVVDFDEAVGLGTVAAAPDDGGERYPFHCTQIAGGSRRVDVGAEVSFTVVPGRSGRWEAAAVTPAAAR